MASRVPSVLVTYFWFFSFKKKQNESKVNTVVIIKINNLEMESVLDQAYENCVLRFILVFSWFRAIILKGFAGIPCFVRCDLLV